MELIKLHCICRPLNPLWATPLRAIIRRSYIQVSLSFSNLSVHCYYDNKEHSILLILLTRGLIFIGYLLWTQSWYNSLRRWRHWLMPVFNGLIRLITLMLFIILCHTRYPLIWGRANKHRFFTAKHKRELNVFWKKKLFKNIPKNNINSFRFNHNAMKKVNILLQVIAPFKWQAATESNCHHKTFVR